MISAEPSAPPAPANAQPYTRAREATSGRPGRRYARSLLPVRLAWLSWAVQLAADRPASLAAVWDHHVRSAAYFDDHPGLKAARYAWGCFNITVTAAGYTIEWWTRSMARSMATAALIVILVWVL